MARKPPTIYSLISYTDQITSQWFINKMTLDTFTLAKPSANFNFFKDAFKLSENATKINNGTESTLFD